MFTAISGAQLNDAMDASRSRRKVLILDCCYSGAFPAGRTAKADEGVQTLERFQGKGRAVLTASDATQYAFEGDDLRGSGTSSVFTRYLVDAISSGAADLDEDGDIALDELYSYVYDRVVAEVPQQRPKKQEDVDGRILIARNVHWTLPDAPPARHREPDRGAAAERRAGARLPVPGGQRRRPDGGDRLPRRPWRVTTAGRSPRRRRRSGRLRHRRAGAPARAAGPGGGAAPAVTVAAAPAPALRRRRTHLGSAGDAADRRRPRLRTGRCAAAARHRGTAGRRDPRTAGPRRGAPGAVPVHRLRRVDGLTAERGRPHDPGLGARGRAPAGRWPCCCSSSGTSTGWTGPLAFGLVLGAVLCQLDQMLFSVAFFVTRTTSVGAGPGVVARGRRNGGADRQPGAARRRSLGRDPRCGGTGGRSSPSSWSSAALVAWLQAFAGYCVWFAGVEPGLLLAGGRPAAVGAVALGGAADGRAGRGDRVRRLAGGVRAARVRRRDLSPRRAVHRHRV